MRWSWSQWNFHVYTIIYPWYFHRLKHHWQERPRDAKYGRWTKKISREKAAVHESRDENHSERRPDEIWWIWNKWPQQIGGRESSQSPIFVISGSFQVWRRWSILLWGWSLEFVPEDILEPRLSIEGYRGMAWGCPKIWETEMCTAHGIFLVLYISSHQMYLRCTPRWSSGLHVFLLNLIAVMILD